VKTVRKDISISDLKLKGTQSIDKKVKYTILPLYKQHSCQLVENIISDSC